MRLLTCYECKQKFPQNDLIFYTPERAKTGHNYCKKCLEEKQARENFSNTVCKIFGLKAPGPRIWTERKRLHDKYGYTDNIIVRCLDYIYHIEMKKQLAESLCLVTPTMVEKMMRYERTQDIKGRLFAINYNQEQNEYIVPIREEVETPQLDDPDKWLNDD